MIQVIARFFISQLQPADLITLGNTLRQAGIAAQSKQDAITKALSHVKFGLDKLTE